MSLLTSWGLLSAHCQVTVLPAGTTVSPFIDGTCHCMVLAPGALCAARADRGASAALGPGAGAGARAAAVDAAPSSVRSADAPEARHRAAMARTSIIGCADLIVIYAGGVAWNGAMIPAERLQVKGKGSREATLKRPPVTQCKLYRAPDFYCIAPK